MVMESGHVAPSRARGRPPCWNCGVLTGEERRYIGSMRASALDAEPRYLPWYTLPAFLGELPMQTAKVFMTGRSQAVRLPAEFRFDTDEVFVRRDPVTRDVILSRRPVDWNEFFARADAAEVPDDFMAERGDVPSQTRDPW